jgi:lipid II:glycine glycyltransferase (peptidoglycan interpeptide bridge formation enzyme)
MHDWWLDAVCEKWDVAIATKGQSVTGVWPYALEQRLRIPMLRTPKLTPYLGPHVFFPDDIRESNRDSFEHETVSALLDQLPDPEVWLLAMPPGLRQAGLFRFFDLQTEVRQTFLIDLTLDEAELYANLKEPLRRNIRGAEKEIVITHDPGCLRLLHDYQKVTLEDKGRTQHHSFADLERLFAACMEHDSGALWVARSPEAEVLAIILQVWDREKSYYLMGARNPASGNYRALSALLWHAILHAKQRGHKIFDLEGSMDPGVERFFRNFGGKRELYLVLRKTHSLLWRLLKR